MIFVRVRLIFLCESSTNFFGCKSLTDERKSCKSSTRFDACKSSTHFDACKSLFHSSEVCNFDSFKSSFTSTEQTGALFYA